MKKLAFRKIKLQAKVTGLESAFATVTSFKFCLTTNSVLKQYHVNFYKFIFISINTTMKRFWAYRRLSKIELVDLVQNENNFLQKGFPNAFLHFTL